MGIFCTKEFTSYVGDAVCRQLGYDNSIDFSKARLSDYGNITMASNFTPIHASTTGYNHIQLQ